MNPGDSGTIDVKCRECGAMNEVGYFVYPFDGESRVWCERCRTLLIESYDGTDYRHLGLKGEGKGA